jgi:hypothetical protein
MSDVPAQVSDWIQRATDNAQSSQGTPADEEPPEQATQPTEADHD